ncbi:MAG: 4Fe-4S dicluster domain-containing protein [Bacteroidia bacterium]|nr:4Fe-4S dicluster domain-containing protein [Bacteroidia bacterium]
MDILSQIQSDPRYAEACRSCLNCGVCTAICPAAGYYDYDPRVIMNLVREGDEETLTGMLSSDLIWYCGQCMSCKPRCPRGNVAGALIQVLRAVSINSGLFVHSTLGRQQLAIKRAIGHNILETGYCVHPTRVDPATHPEQGPVWAWMSTNADRVYGRFDQGYDKSGPGLLRKISPDALGELDRIFEVTGCKDLWNKIETESKR